jgi:hypothetical protein
VFSVEADPAEPDPELADPDVADPDEADPAFAPFVGALGAPCVVDFGVACVCPCRPVVAINGSASSAPYHTYLLLFILLLLKATRGFFAAPPAALLAKIDRFNAQVLGRLSQLFLDAQ